MAYIFYILYNFVYTCLRLVLFFVILFLRPSLAIYFLHAFAISNCLRILLLNYTRSKTTDERPLALSLLSLKPITTRTRSTNTTSYLSAHTLLPTLLVLLALIHLIHTQLFKDSTNSPLSSKPSHWFHVLSTSASFSCLNLNRRTRWRWISQKVSKTRRLSIDLCPHFGDHGVAFALPLACERRTCEGNELSFGEKSGVGTICSFIFLGICHIFWATKFCTIFGPFLGDFLSPSFRFALYA